MSSSDTGVIVIPTMTAVPTEDFIIDKLHLVQQSGKSVGLMDSSGRLSGEVSDPTTFASLAAGGGSFDCHILMEN